MEFRRSGASLKGLRRFVKGKNGLYFAEKYRRTQQY
jgi:hypothetical protein